MSAAVAVVEERTWNGITYDPDEPDVTGYRTIRDLPPVVGSEVACPGCGQTLDVICGDALVVPQRHYRRPTTVTAGNERIERVGTTGNYGKASETLDALCPVNSDCLNGVIARAQRAAATVSA